MAGVCIRRCADPEPQLRPRSSERLPGCAGHLAAVPAALFLGKALANMVLLLTVELICLPVFGIFYDVSWTRQIGTLLLVLVLTSWALSVVGTMFSALTVNLRLRELMLPTLVYPIMIPGLLAAIQLTTLLAVGEPLTAEYYPWLRLLTGFDVIYTLLGLALVDTVLVG